MPYRKRYGKKRPYTKRRATTRKVRRGKRGGKKTGTNVFPKTKSVTASKLPMQLLKASNRTLILRSWRFDASGQDDIDTQFNQFIYLRSPAGNAGESGLYYCRLAWKMADMSADIKQQMNNFDYVKPMACTWHFTFPFNSFSIIGSPTALPTIFSGGAAGYAPIEYWWYYDWDTDDLINDGNVIDGELPQIPSTVAADYYAVMTELQSRNNVHHGYLNPKRPTLKITLAPGRMLTPVMLYGTQNIPVTYSPQFSRNPGWMRNNSNGDGTNMGEAAWAVMRGIRLVIRAPAGWPLQPTFDSPDSAKPNHSELGVTVQKEMFVAVKGRKTSGEIS